MHLAVGILTRLKPWLSPLFPTVRSALFWHREYSPIMQPITHLYLGIVNTTFTPRKRQLKMSDYPWIRIRGGFIFNLVISWVQIFSVGHFWRWLLISSFEHLLNERLSRSQYTVGPWIFSRLLAMWTGLRGHNRISTWKKLFRTKQKRLNGEFSS